MDNKFEKANSHEVIKYKMLILSLIVNDAEIISAIDNNTVEYPDDLIYKNIFPFIKIPGTEQEAFTYILFSVDIPNTINKNNIMKDIYITFVVSTHQDLMKVKKTVANRVDLLAYLIDKKFNGSDVFGIGYLELISNMEGNLDRTHPCRTIKFRTEGYKSKNGQGNNSVIKT